MNTKPILNAQRVQCYYHSSYDLSDIAQRGQNLANSHKEPTGQHPPVGHDDTYEKTIANYDPSVDFLSLRNRWVRGEEVSPDEVCINKPPPVVKEVELTSDQKSKISRYEYDIRRLRKKIESLTLAGGIANTNRIERFKTYIRQNEKIISSIKNGTVQTVAAPLLKGEYSDDEDFDSEGDDSDGIEVSAPQQVYSVPSRIPVDSVPSSHSSSHSSTSPSPSKNVDEDYVFDRLARLNWTDRDEHVLNKTAVNKLTPDEIRLMMPIMDKLAADLHAAISNKTGILEEMQEDDRMNFLYHVIAKGKTIYFESCIDPDFCLHMVDLWQPLHDYMRNKVRG